MFDKGVMIFWRTVLLGLLSFSILTHLSTTAVLNNLKTDTNKVRINNVEIYYREFGKNDAPAIVFLHGFGGSSYDWKYILTSLENNYRCIAIDIPPFGLSEKAKNFDYSDLSIIQTIMGVLDTLKVEKFTLVGHSMGGYLSIAISVLYPERVERLVLFDAAYSVPSNRADVDDSSRLQNASGQSFLDEDKNLKFFQLLLDIGIKTYPAFKFVYRNTLSEGELFDSEHFDYLFAQNYFLPAEILIKFSQDKVKQTPLEINLDKIYAKTLIIYGEKDNITPPSIGEYLSKNIKNSTFILIPGEGHMPLSNTLAIEELIKFLSE
ncbi:alpha/beta fold hydrolase [Fervidobacterium sp.]